MLSVIDNPRSVRRRLTCGRVKAPNILNGYAYHVWRILKRQSLIHKCRFWSDSYWRYAYEHHKESCTPDSDDQLPDGLRRLAEKRLANLCCCRSPSGSWSSESGVQLSL